MQDAIANCSCCSAELKAAMQRWIDGKDSSALGAAASEKLIPMMEACGYDTCKEILEWKQYFVKKSQWIIGGDGWGGYDIGFGGVDHVLFGCRRQHPDPRHRGLFEYGRTVVPRPPR